MISIKHQFIDQLFVRYLQSDRASFNYFYNNFFFINNFALGL